MCSLSLPRRLYYKYTTLNEDPLFCSSDTVFLGMRGRRQKDTEKLKNNTLASFIMNER
jgi:hypothetical protein